MKDKNIVLIGMPGCGKTTIGKELSKKINYKLIDMDNFIEDTTKMKIGDIFKNGEDAFRSIETNACKELSKLKNTIISCGGGVIKKEENIKYLKSNSVIIFIDRDVESILSDIEVEKRPLLANGKEVLYKLYNERYELYKKYCDYRIENKLSIEEVVNKIIEIV